MILLAFCPPILPGLMLLPVLLALQNDKENSDDQIKLSVKNFTIGFFWGTILYLAVLILFNTLFKVEAFRVDVWEWSWYQNLGLIFPILVGLGITFFRTHQQITTNPLRVKSFSAGVLYLVLIAPHYLLLFFLRLFTGDSPTTTTFLVLLFPGLTGLWLASMISKHTKKYFEVYIVVAIVFIIFSFLIISILSSVVP